MKDPQAFFFVHESVCFLSSVDEKGRWLLRAEEDGNLLVVGTKKELLRGVLLRRTRNTLSRKDQVIQHFDVQEGTSTFDLQGQLFMGREGFSAPEGWLWERIMDTAFTFRSVVFGGDDAAARNGIYDPVIKL